MEQRPYESVNANVVPAIPPANINPPEFKAQPSYHEDLDIPTFLRNRR
jgi:hypothetical protein